MSDYREKEKLYNWALDLYHTFTKKKKKKIAETFRTSLSVLIH